MRPSSPYLPRLDHLRFLAALLVLAMHTLEHFVPHADFPPAWAFPLSLLAEGHTGVSLFLVLSGYIFMEICRDRDVSYGEYLRSRALRIGPLFLCWLSLQLWTYPAADPLKAVGAVLTLSNRDLQIPGVGWTVLVEVQFYLIFPFLLRFYRRDGLRFLLGLLTIALLTRLALHLGGVPIRRMAFISLFGRIDQFLLGMIACELSRRRPSLFRSPWLFAGSVVGWAALYHLYDRLGGMYDFPGHGVWVVLPTLEGLAYALWTACWLACPLALPRVLDDGLAWMGRLSYSFYLTHMMVLNMCVGLARGAGLVPDSLGTGVLFLIAVVLPPLTLFSYLTYTYIEQPFLSLRRTYAPGTEDAPALRSAA